MASLDSKKRTVQNVLFVCHHNSARSQMAEAFLNDRYGEYFQAFSAGTEPSAELDPRAVVVMREVGLNISNMTPKSVDEFIRAGTRFEYVVTTCYEAKRHCPYIPAPEQVHARFDDPRTFEGNDEEQLEQMRRLRDQISEWVDRFFGPRASLQELEEQPVR